MQNTPTNSQKTNAISTRVNSLNDQEGYLSLILDVFDRAVSPSQQIKLIHKTSKDDQSDPIRFLGNIFSNTLSAKQQVKSCESRQALNFLLSQTAFHSVVHKKYLHWEVLQNDHHFKKGRSILIYDDSFQGQDENNNSNTIVLKDIYQPILEQEVKQEKIQDFIEGFFIKKIEESHQIKKLQKKGQQSLQDANSLKQRQKNYSIKILSAHSQSSQKQDDSECEILQETIIAQCNNQMQNLIQSQHFFDPDQNLIQQLISKRQQKIRRIGLDQLQQSIIQITSYHQLPENQCDFSHFQQVFLQDQEENIENIRVNVNVQNSRIRSETFSVDPKFRYTSIRTQKKKDCQPNRQNLLQKQKTCIRQGNSGMLSSQILGSGPSNNQQGQKKSKSKGFAFSSLNFLSKIMESNAGNFVIKINQKSNNINIEVIPSQNLIRNSQSQQNIRQSPKNHILNSQNKTKHILQNSHKLFQNVQGPNQFIYQSHRKQQIKDFIQKNSVQGGRIQKHNKTPNKVVSKKRTNSLNLLKSQEMIKNKLKVSTNSIMPIRSTLSQGKKKTLNLMNKILLQENHLQFLNNKSNLKSKHNKLKKKNKKRQKKKSQGSNKIKQKQLLQKKESIKEIFHKKNSVSINSFQNQLSSNEDNQQQMQQSTNNQKIIEKIKNMKKKINLLQKLCQKKIAKKKSKPISSQAQFQFQLFQKSLKFANNNEKQICSRVLVQPFFDYDETRLKQYAEYSQQSEKRKNPQSGLIYQGEWKNGLRHGKGKLYSSQNQIYFGQFQNGIKSGYGQQKFLNGEIYKGQYKNNKFQGKGLYQWRNGSTYQGQFKQGKINGYGVWKTKMKPINQENKTNIRQLSEKKVMKQIGRN